MKYCKNCRLKFAQQSCRRNVNTYTDIGEDGSFLTNRDTNNKGLCPDYRRKWLRFFRAK